jgi:hypothetical protein
MSYIPQPTESTQQPTRHASRRVRWANPVKGTGQSAGMANRRLRWSEPIDLNCPNPLSPAATSEPIPILGRGRDEIAMPRFQDLRARIPKNMATYQHLPGFEEAEPRAHHWLDNITNYCLPGACGWQFAQEYRVKQSNAQAGKILAGQWPPASPWRKQHVARKDPNFGFVNESYLDKTPEEWEDVEGEATEGISHLKHAKHLHSERVRVKTEKTKNWLRKV